MLLKATAGEIALFRAALRPLLLYFKAIIQADLRQRHGTSMRRLFHRLARKTVDNLAGDKIVHVPQNSLLYPNLRCLNR
jgi:hypothetical protein